MKIAKENESTYKKKNQKSARLIVRNLPFKCNEESVRQHFSKFGEISEVKLLRKGDKLIGCGFVQFDNKLNASKAISKLSGNDFMGRPIVVDWAVPKDKFNQLNGQGKNNVKEESENIIKEEDDSDEKKISPVVLSDIKEEEVIESDGSSEESDSDESGSGSDSKASDSEVDDDNSVKEKGKRVNEESDDEPVSKKRKLNENSEKKQKFRYDPNDVSDGRTVFIKNIPFSVKDDDLRKCAEEVGAVIYAVVCVDPLTEHSKGTGFVKYQDKTVVNALISGNLNLSLNGIKLQPFLALKKNQIENMKDKKTPKDNRNLYLVREGVIIAGSPAAEGVSEADMAKRLQLEHWKTQTLRNLNKFVSPIRLVVHNIPPFLDDDKLRQIFKKHSPKGSIIREARIMRNLNDIDEHGVGRSKGFGFVCFTKHEHALEALRTINNNPTVFKESKRPIVGFSIENMTALKLKEKRKERSKDVNNSSHNIAPNQNNKKVHDGTKKKSSVNNVIKSSHTVPNQKKGKANDGVNKKRSYDNSENLPSFSGNVSKPGIKKMRSRKELSMQAKLHHQSAIERKLSKKKFHYSKKFKSKVKGNRRVKK